MDSDMLIYSTLLVFAQEEKDIYVLTMCGVEVPRRLIVKHSKHTLEEAKEKFKEITGIKHWPIYFKQVGVYEHTEGASKMFDILYLVCLSGLHGKLAEDYRWTKLSELDEKSTDYAIISYGAGQRVQ